MNVFILDAVLFRPIKWLIVTKLGHMKFSQQTNLPLVKVNQYAYLLSGSLNSKYDKGNCTNVFTKENSSDNQWMT